MLGGVYGCDKMNWVVDDGFVVDAGMQKKLCAFWGVVMKVHSPLMLPLSFLPQYTSSDTRSLIPSLLPLYYTYQP